MFLERTNIQSGNNNIMIVAQDKNSIDYQKIGGFLGSSVG